MRLVYVIAAILAVSVAESDKDKVYEDLEAMETMELKKEGHDLAPAASAYNYVPNNQQNWNQNYVPQYPPPNNPLHTHSPAPPFIYPTAKPPAPVNYPVNDYPSHNNWNNHHPTTTPVSVIKNDVYYGDNKSYRYEYKLSDGTDVGQDGYFTDPRGTDESIVKRGWYSFRGDDGKTYTVTYFADSTGFHAYGAHLPTAPPLPRAHQEALDKLEAERKKLEAVNNGKPQYDEGYYPTSSQQPSYNQHKPAQVQPAYNPQPQPTQPTYNPPQYDQPSYPQPQPQPPIYNPSQSQQPTYYPSVPQQPTYTPQQGSYPQPPSYPTYNK